MDTTWFHCLENMYYLPLIQLNLSDGGDILLMCSSLWNISLVLELHFHWILAFSVILEHVVYHVNHCLPLCNNFGKELETSNHDNIGLFSFHLIDFMMNCE